MGIDLLQGNMVLQKALVDVDDGTLDGNLRLRAFATDPNPDGINTADSRRGDGMIDMSDFRAYRDAFLHSSVEKGSIVPGDVLLDGPLEHFKLDFNFDGCASGVDFTGPDAVVFSNPVSPQHPVDVPATPTCTGASLENVFSRYDFNGDGDMHTQGLLAPFKLDPDGTDLSSWQSDGEVLSNQALWTVDGENTVPRNHPELCNNSASAWDCEEAFSDWWYSFDLHLKLLDDALLYVDSPISRTVIVERYIDNAYEGILTHPVMSYRFPGEYTEINYKKSTELGDESKELWLRSYPGLGEDLKLEVGFNTLDYQSVERGLDTNLFPRSLQEMVWFKSFQIIGGSDPAVIQAQLVAYANSQVIPNSLLGQWLGAGNVEGTFYVTPVDCVTFDEDFNCLAYEGYLAGVGIIGKD